MEELEFLTKDENILEAEIVDVTDEKGNSTVGLSLLVGMNDDQINNLCDLVGVENISKIPTGFEVILTKKDLNKILKLFKEHY